MVKSHRELRTIAHEITRDWRNPSYTAQPYIRAMAELSDMKSKYYNDDAQDIVLRFLGNATSWHGTVARRIKEELRQMLRDSGYKGIK